MKTFHGAWPALITPLTADDQVNISVLKGLVDYLVDKHVDGLYVCGSTGQGIYLTPAERKLTLETVLSQVGDRIPVIAHIGSQTLPDAVELAAHAQDAGADGISSIIPAGFTALESIGQYYATVAAAAPDLPFLPYIFTSTMDAVAMMTNLQTVPNLGGTKYTGPNMHEFRRIVDVSDSRSGSGKEAWTVFSGMDQQCVFAAMFGSSGNIGSTLNVMPGIYRRIHQCCHDGDFGQARDLQIRANRVTEAMFRFGFLGALRVALAMLGYDPGPPRLPAQALPADQHDALARALEAVDFEEIAAMD